MRALPTVNCQLFNGKRGRSDTTSFCDFSFPHFHFSEAIRSFGHLVISSFCHFSFREALVFCSEIPSGYFTTRLAHHHIESHHQHETDGKADGRRCRSTDVDQPMSSTSAKRLRQYGFVLRSVFTTADYVESTHVRQ